MIQSIFDLLTCIFIVLYIISTPVSAVWDYPMEPVIPFPEKYTDNFDYALHTAAYFIACLCFLLFLVFLAAFILLAVVFTCDATGWVAHKMYRMFAARQG
jgi:hypothetical protein